MNSADVVAALDLPAAARVEQRVPKKLLVENGSPTVADKRRITEGFEEFHWMAALKPATIGVPEYRDSEREYLEIAVLSAVLRASAKAARLTELIHRAVPYPVLLLTSQGESLNLSLAHKRWSQGQAGATVLDGGLLAADIRSKQLSGFAQPFASSLSTSRQPGMNLYALYDGWIDTVVALLAAGVTGRFSMAESREHAAARRAALGECARLEVEAARLRTSAAREKQVARQVELNLQLKQVQAEYSAARDTL